MPRLRRIMDTLSSFYLNTQLLCIPIVVNCLRRSDGRWWPSIPIYTQYFSIYSLCPLLSFGIPSLLTPIASEVFPFRRTIYEQKLFDRSRRARAPQFPSPSFAPCSHDCILQLWRQQGHRVTMAHRLNQLGCAI